MKSCAVSFGLESSQTIWFFVISRKHLCRNTCVRLELLWRFYQTWNAESIAVMCFVHVQSVLVSSLEKHALTAN